MSLFDGIGNWGVSQVNSILSDPQPSLWGTVTDAAGQALWGILYQGQNVLGGNIPGILGGTTGNGTQTPANSGSGTTKPKGAGLGSGALLIGAAVLFLMMNSGGGRKRR